MPDKQDREWRKLTFSQREGKAPLPEPLQAGKLTEKFKIRVWDIFAPSIGRGISGDGWSDSLEGTYWRKLTLSYHFNVLEMPHDKFKTNPFSVYNWIKSLIFKGEYHEILTLLEYMLRCQNIPKKLKNKINECMQFAPYLIDSSSHPVCIVPVTSEEMKETVKQSLDNINKSELIGAKSHLRKAAQELNNENYSNSMRESIHAVESMMRNITPEKQNSFASMLDWLANKKVIKHKSLKEAFKKLYNYTNDEKGIRHSLVDKEAADVGFDEAIFMYAACVAFVDYLVSKQRQLEGGGAG